MSRCLGFGRLFRRRQRLTRRTVGDNSHGKGATNEDKSLGEVWNRRIESSGEAMSLLATGSKHFTFLGGLASVRLYDFSIHVDAQNLACTSHQAEGRVDKRRRRGGRAGQTLADEGETSALANLFRLPSSTISFSNQSAKAGKVNSLPDAKIILYAARDLPLDELRKELTRVLSARLPPNSQDDNQKSKMVLDHLLSALSRERLPPSALSPSMSHIRVGNSLQFLRSDCGGQDEDEEEGPAACRITLSEGGGQELSQVRSAELSFALFDLFLGENAVEPKARRQAAHRIKLISERNRSNAISYRHHS
jgi:hypothetical protein